MDDVDRNGALHLVLDVRERLQVLEAELGRAADALRRPAPPLEGFAAEWRSPFSRSVHRRSAREVAGDV